MIIATATEQLKATSLFCKQTMFILFKKCHNDEQKYNKNDEIHFINFCVSKSLSSSLDSAVSALALASDMDSFF